MANAPYHPVKDFTLFIIGNVPMVISCNPALPARTLPEFVALLMANPTGIATLRPVWAASATLAASSSR